MLRVEALTEALERVAQGGVPLELMQDIQELMLRDMEKLFHGEPPALVTPMRLR